MSLADKQCLSLQLQKHPRTPTGQQGALHADEDPFLADDGMLTTEAEVGGWGRGSMDR